MNTNRSLSGVNGGGGGIDRADIVTSANLAAAQVGDPLAVPFNHNAVILGSPTQWFNPHMFTLGPVGFLGDASRNMLRGPHLNNLDFSINKDTPLKFLGEQGSLEFRAELFNILNHPNFAMPSSTVFTGQTTVTSQAPISNVGIITATSADSREIQFALKMIF